MATIWVLQKGSPESKPLDESGRESNAQSLTGWNAYNQEQLDHGAAQISWIAYLGNAEFWETTL